MLELPPQLITKCVTEKRAASRPARSGCPRKNPRSASGCRGGVSLSLGYLGRHPPTHTPPRRQGMVSLKLTAALSSRLCSPRFPSSPALTAPRDRDT